MAKAQAIPAAGTAEISFRDRHISRTGKAGIEVKILDALASLKFTVALFVFGIFVVLVGTLAQVEMDIWEVVAKYFHTWVMWVNVRYFFPPSFFPDWVPSEDLFTNGFHFPRSGSELWNYLWFHGGFPAPGGWTIGWAMAVNLLAAHFWRFKIQGKGSRLWAGLGVIVVGAIFLSVVVLGGNGNATQAVQPLFNASQIWVLFRVILAVAWVALSVYFFQQVSNAISSENTEKSPLAIKQVLALSIVLYLAVSALVVMLLTNYLAPQPEATRILWQIIIATFGSLILYAGCYLVFVKRAGIVLLHAGVGILMANELIVNRYAVEWQVSLEEGQTSNYLRDIRTTELAIVVPGQDGEDHEVVIPRSLIEANHSLNKQLAKEGKDLVPLKSPVLDKLPFQVSVVEYYKNAELTPASTKEEQKLILATAGMALEQGDIVIPQRAMTGTDMDKGVDMAAAYLRVTDKKTGKDLGTYLLAQLSAEQASPERYAEKVAVDGKTYEFYLRFARSYRDFEVSLVDVRKDDYLGTDTVRNYSSDIVVSRKELAKPASFHIRMNDPLRYDGLTFYQSGYNRMQNGKELTTLAVVSNQGWMIPYVACMIISVAMLGHFAQMLLAFLQKLGREDKKNASVQTSQYPTSLPFMAGGKWGLPAAVGVSLMLFLVVSMIRPIKTNTDAVVETYAENIKAVALPDFQKSIKQFSQLTVLDNGRAMPIDTLARNSLRAISGREIPSFTLLKLKDGKPFKDERGVYVLVTKSNGRTPMMWSAEPAEWFLHSITQSEISIYVRQFKIDSPEVAKIFQSHANPGNMYSLFELGSGMEQFAKLSDEIDQKIKAKQSLNPEERKIRELGEKLATYFKMMKAFNRPELPPLPPLNSLERDPEGAQREISRFLAACESIRDQLSQVKYPLTIPLFDEEVSSSKRKDATSKNWKSYPEAWLSDFIDSRAKGKESDPMFLAWNRVADAFERRDSKEFASAVASLKTRQETVIRKLNRETEPGKPDYVPLEKVPVEARFNAISPFYVGVVLYTFCLIGAPLAWLLRSRDVGKTVFVMVLFALVFHSVALVFRIYISGRPPVTNLYSSAVFIAWAGVIFGLALEMVYRIGIGNMIAAICGFGGLLIAYFLSAGGDTIGVLQAVLDTQFWLATHVVLITLGYAATFVAGFIGVLYVVGGVFTKNLVETDRKDLGRMIYGATCFAIFCSFIGTILGGLWADDSWGRFWGWDPKENGAMIIVLWNAVLLHARWDKMAGDRGMAVLAIFGNIVTAWSWFGVNQLGIGLHAYGGAELSVIRSLGIGIAVHLALIAIGLLPVRLWLSYQAVEGESQVVRT
ncbi:MAG: cytochrome c biogenesis protein CcsA [Planctomycetaceae bacterium]